MVVIAQSDRSSWPGVVHTLVEHAFEKPAFTSVPTGTSRGSWRRQPESGVRHESIERGRLEPSRDLVHMRAEKPSSHSFSSVAHKSRELGGVRSIRNHEASSPT